MKTELNAVWDPSDSEVDLFRKMSKILSAKYQVSFVEEIHKRSIRFSSATLSQDATRELGDLWIIAYKPSTQRAKMTFLQAKYHRGNIGHPGSLKGDYFQYELLSTRPPLVSGGIHNFPGDILGFSCCDSVGSYGVFYLDLTHQINLAYCTAKLLTTSTPLPTTYQQYNVHLEFPSIPVTVSGCNSCGSCSELNYSYDIDDFIQNVLHLNIGADLHHHPAIMSYLQSVLAQIPRSGTGISGLQTFLARHRNGGEDGINTNDFTNDNPVPGNLLIINVDAKNE